MITAVVREGFVEMVDDFKSRRALSSAEIVGLMAEYIRNQMHTQALAELDKARERRDRHNGGR